MEREKVMATVEHLFQREECVPRETLLAEIERSAPIGDEEKRILRSLPERDCYTRESFAAVLTGYGPDVPGAFSSSLGG